MRKKRALIVAIMLLLMLVAYPGYTKAFAEPAEGGEDIGNEESYSVEVTYEGSGIITGSFENGSGTYTESSSEEERTVYWTADEGYIVQSVTINGDPVAEFEGQTEGSYTCTTGGVIMHIVFEESSESNEGNEPNTDGDSESNNEDIGIREFLNENCFCQTPEGKDNYVSAFVNMERESASDISYQDVIDNLKITVTAKGHDYDTRYAIDDKERFVFTTKTLESGATLKEGETITVTYKYFENGEGSDLLAERTEAVRVGPALGETRYEKKVLTLTVTPNNKEYVYNGKENKTTVTLTGKTAGGKSFSNVALRDSFDSSYENTKSAAGGKNRAKVTITMEGDYTGTGSATYSILPREIVINTIKAKTSSYVYNGSARKSGVTLTAVYKDTGKAVPASVLNDVTSNVRLDYEKTINVGTAKVTATMKNNYKSNSKSATYLVNPKLTTLSSVRPLKKGFTVKWRAQKTKMKTFWITGYQIQYSTNKKFKSGNKLVTVGKKENKDYKLTSKKITKLKAKKKYYVRVRTYKKLNGKNYYSSWSESKAVTTKK